MHNTKSDPTTGRSPLAAAAEAEAQPAAQQELNPQQADSSAADAFETSDAPAIAAQARSPAMQRDAAAAPAPQVAAASPAAAPPAGNGCELPWDPGDVAAGSSAAGAKPAALDAAEAPAAARAAQQKAASEAAAAQAADSATATAAGSATVEAAPDALHDRPSNSLQAVADGAPVTAAFAHRSACAAAASADVVSAQQPAPLRGANSPAAAAAAAVLSSAQAPTAAGSVATPLPMTTLETADASAEQTAAAAPQAAHAVAAAEPPAGVATLDPSALAAMPEEAVLCSAATATPAALQYPQPAEQLCSEPQTLATLPTAGLEHTPSGDDANGSDAGAAAPEARLATTAASGFANADRAVEHVLPGRPAAAAVLPVLGRQPMDASPTPDDSQLAAGKPGLPPGAAVLWLYDGFATRSMVSSSCMSAEHQACLPLCD